MKTKIIISLCLLISAHNSFCMLMNPNQKNMFKKICTAQQPNQKAADKYLKPFMLRSLLKNSEMFDKQSLAVQRTIIRQCKEKHDTSPIIGLIQLPIEDQTKIISYFFEDQCRKAAEYFISIPLEMALIKYNDFPKNTLTLLQPRAKLSQSIIFRLTKEEEIILAAIYTDQTMATKKLKVLLKLLPHDILQTILQQNLNVITPENENKLIALLTTPYRTIRSRPSNQILFLTKFYGAGALTTTLASLIYDNSLMNLKFLFFAIKWHSLGLTFAIPTCYCNDWKENYNDEITKTITTPLKSLL